MWEGILKISRRRNRGGCTIRRIPDRVWRMLLRAFILNFLKFLKMLTKVGIMAIFSTNGVGLVGLKFLIPWQSRVCVPLLLWRAGSRKLLSIRSILLGGGYPVGSYYCLFHSIGCCFGVDYFNCLLVDSMNKARPC